MRRATSIAWSLGLMAVALPAAAQTPTPPPPPAAGTNAPAVQPPVLPEDAQKSRDTFDRHIRNIEQRTSRRTKTLGAAYATQLKDLRATLQITGRVRDMAIVHDEIARFAKENTIPALDAVKEPAELRRIVAQLAAQGRDELHADEVEVVAAAARHLQNLGTLGEQMVIGERTGSLEAVEAERDRVMALPGLRAALATSATPPDRAVAGPVAPEAPPADESVEFRKLRMSAPAGEDAGRVMGIAIDAALREDRTRMYQSKTEGSPKLGFSETSAGPIQYKLRVTVSGRNSEIPPDCRLVVEYFRRSLTDGSRSFLSTEEIKIPPVGKNESRTFEMKGVELTQSETRNTTVVGSNRTFSGHELYGFIASLIGPSGRVVIQRFTPQSLGKEVIPVPGKRAP